MACFKLLLVVGLVATLVAAAPKNITVSKYTDPLCGTFGNNWSIPEGLCLPEQDGTAGRLHCLKMPKAMCASVLLWNGTTGCPGTASLKSASRCGTCEGFGRGFFKLECEKFNATTGKFNMLSNCTSRTCDPSSCQKIEVSLNTCINRQVPFVHSVQVTAVNSCPDLVAWAHFNDTKCTKMDKEGTHIFPAGRCLDGYKYYC